MKKYFITMVAIVCSCLFTNAQELTKKMFSLYYGQPKTLVQSSNMSSETITIEFDRSGRVTSKSMGSGKMVYNWRADGNSIEIKAYNNGQQMGSTIVYIKEMSSSQYRYEADGTTCMVTFRDNGSIGKMTLSGGGQTMTTTYYYNSSSDTYPYKMATAAGGQSMSVSVSGINKDSQGNPIRYTQSAQGQSGVFINTITYY